MDSGARTRCGRPGDEQTRPVVTCVQTPAETMLTDADKVGQGLEPSPLGEEVITEFPETRQPAAPSGLLRPGSLQKPKCFPNIYSVVEARPKL